jgi:hypothetical protein
LFLALIWHFPRPVGDEEVRGGEEPKIGGVSDSSPGARRIGRGSFDPGVSNASQAKSVDQTLIGPAWKKARDSCPDAAFDPPDNRSSNAMRGLERRHVNGTRPAPEENGPAAQRTIRRDLLRAIDRSSS